MFLIMSGAFDPNLQQRLPQPQTQTDSLAVAACCPEKIKRPLENEVPLEFNWIAPSLSDSSYLFLQEAERERQSEQEHIRAHIQELRGQQTQQSRELQRKGEKRSFCTKLRLTSSSRQLFLVVSLDCPNALKAFWDTQSCVCCKHSFKG